MKTIYVSVDPGRSGSMCVKTPEEVRVFDCPDDPSGIAALVRNLYKEFNPKLFNYVLRIERVHAAPMFGSKGNFGLGHNLGCWEASFALVGVTYETVTPVTWQEICSHEKAGLITKKTKLKDGSTKEVQKPNPKEKSWRFSRKKFPELIHLLGEKVPNSSSKESNRADALCILAWTIENCGDK